MAGDVVELILADHRRFEDLLRQLRDSSSDRDAVRGVLAALHVAHAEAEERHVYPTLRKKRAIDADEVEHGEEAVLELKGTSWAWTSPPSATPKLHADCGRIANVRAIVARAEKEGLLDDAGEAAAE